MIRCNRTPFRLWAGSLCLSRLKPMSMHLRKQFGSQRYRHGGRQNSVDAASGAQRSNSFRGFSTDRRWLIDPLGDLAGVEDLSAVEAPGAVAAIEERAVVVAESMNGLEVGAASHHANSVGVVVQIA